jgi:hypothetical protein
MLPPLATQLAPAGARPRSGNPRATSRRHGNLRGRRKP